MPNKRNSATCDEALYDFISDATGDDYRRVEQDLGLGYYRLCTTEADKRQADQDIRLSEDIIIELLRNSRDANASNIFIATQKNFTNRIILVIDDGVGIPESVQDLIFQPRVTSKLDSAHLDKWGFHGRGMALFSISVNSINSKVVLSKESLGSSIKVETDLSQIGEKKDQSTFPHFEKIDDTFSMRGPKNILRCAAEFAIEHEDINVYCGSFTEIAATMWAKGNSLVPASIRAFNKPDDTIKLCNLLSFSSDASEFASIASTLGLEISTRSAMRILNNEISPLKSLSERVKDESFRTNNQESKIIVNDSQQKDAASKPRLPKISREDLDLLCAKLQSEFSIIAQKYYLADLPALAKQSNDKLTIEFKILEKD